jgi:hypothetical protein
MKPSLFVLAEVMDKEPSSLRNWLVLVGLDILGFALGRYRWWAGLLVLPLIAVYAWGLVAEQLDSSVGPAIRAEAGVSYLAQAVVAATLALGLVLVGVGNRNRRVA